jgi:aspartyl aminopeptidase
MEFLDFLKNSPTAFHAVKELSKILDKSGFKKINENDKWNLNKGEKYYFTRNNSSLLAFIMPNKIESLSYNIVASHTDSPTFKIKPNYTLEKDRYNELNTEIYGGPIYNTWMDRPLNIAGRIIVKDNKELKTLLISFDKPMCIIPNCSIHYYHELNTGVKLNPQIDLMPIFSDNNINNADLLDLISKKLNIKKENIISHDLYLSLMDRGSIVGANDEFITAPQIDNLESAYASIDALKDINSKDSSINIAVLFDNEEIGSKTRQGAASMMLADTLKRISLSLGLNEEEHLIALANSFIISLDNAQGYHPNYPSKYDPTNKVFLNDGIVIKNAARGSYTTDAVSQAYFIEICKKANAKYQLNTNRSDIPGGSTLGAISLSNVSIHSIDIGLPQVAMHSAMETAGRFDYDELIKALKEFYNTHLYLKEDGYLSFE